MALIEMTSEMCMSQKGYFLTGAKTNDGYGKTKDRFAIHNQLCPKAPNPIVFLSAAGVDFGGRLCALREGSKYFKREEPLSKNAITQGRAKAILEQGLGQGGPYNNASNDLFLRCNIVFHGRDIKYLASELAAQDLAPSYLNPSDTRALMFGRIGMHWEFGRGDNYVGEEDWGATTTGVLGDLNIAGNALGLDDVMILTESHGWIRLHRSSASLLAQANDKTLDIQDQETEVGDNIAESFCQLFRTQGKVDCIWSSSSPPEECDMGHAARRGTSGQYYCAQYKVLEDAQHAVQALKRKPEEGNQEIIAITLKQFVYLPEKSDHAILLENADSEASGMGHSMMSVCGPIDGKSDMPFPILVGSKKRKDVDGKWKTLDEFQKRYDKVDVANHRWKRAGVLKVGKYKGITGEPWVLKELRFGGRHCRSLRDRWLLDELRKEHRNGKPAEAEALFMKGNHRDVAYWHKVVETDKGCTQ
eukprot:gene57195-biopygen115017